MAAINTGDTAWVLISAALVMVMTPGLAFFYGGLVRRHNVVATLLQVGVALGVVSLQWVLFGYSLAFGPDVHHLIGSLAWAGFHGVGAAPQAAYAPHIPHEVFAIYQMMFAVITPALIVGGLAERVRLSAFALFVLLWSTFVYDPVAHWVWGAGGWLHTLGALDFAGGTVVHVTSGVAALIAAIVLGARHRREEGAHNVPLVLLGTALLWFGWFGFNAGSALGANGIAATAFLTTNTAAAAAALAWVLADRRITLVGACSGAVAGLVAITPASGFVTPLGALAIGALGGFICRTAAVVLKAKLGYDDTLDAFGCHGVGGTWGALATGLFASLAVNRAGANGLFYGNPRQLLVQLAAVAVTWAYAAIATWVLLVLVNKLVGLRVDREDEYLGLDLALHGEPAYGSAEVGPAMVP